MIDRVARKVAVAVSSSVCVAVHRFGPVACSVRSSLGLVPVGRVWSRCLNRRSQTGLAFLVIPVFRFPCVFMFGGIIHSRVSSVFVAPPVVRISRFLRREHNALAEDVGRALERNKKSFLD